LPRVERSRIALLGAWVAAWVAVAALAGSAPQAVASEPPDVDVRAWALVDPADGEVLAARAPHRRAPVASTTKLMTAYVARRALRLDERVTVPAYAGSPAESLLGLSEGERIRVRDLLAGLLLASGNDAAVALAEASSGSISSFVDEMNRAARRLGLADTRFANPIGLDEPGNRSSPADLAALAIELRRDPFLRGLFDAPRMRLLSGARRREVVNRNDLVRSVPWVNGVKTGQTMGAGHVLVGSGTRKGVTLVSVVLGAPDEAVRDAATLRLLRYGFSLYHRISPVGRSERLATTSVRYRDRRLPLLAARAVRVTVREDQEIAIRPIAPDVVEGPIDRGQRIGRAVVTLDGEVVARVPLLAARNVSAPSMVERVDAFLPGGRLVTWMLAVVTLALCIGLGVMLATRSRRRRREAG
jgi:serine-type D-Ala-D-Ala carboxypeptidase (penicillin-binding protein 5/6)